jgi:hypothetical protein
MSEPLSYRIASPIVEFEGTTGSFSADDQGVYFTEYLGNGEYGVTRLVARPAYLGPDRRDPTRIRRSTDKWPGFVSNTGSPFPGDRRKR